MITHEIKITASFDAELRNCKVFADANPKVILIQLLERKEADFFEKEVMMIHEKAEKEFVMAGLPIIDWCKELMPWNDPAVDRRPESGEFAEEILQLVEKQLLPKLREQYGNLPCIFGGYSLGALFALWGSTKSTEFKAIAAASPSVWIANWMEYVAKHPIKAKKVYMSLGDREEIVKNQHMKRVGDNIRAYHQQLLELMGEENTVLEWNQGGHFLDFEKRICNAFLWCLKG